MALLVIDHFIEKSASLRIIDVRVTNIATFVISKALLITYGQCVDTLALLVQVIHQEHGWIFDLQRVYEKITTGCTVVVACVR